MKQWKTSYDENRERDKKLVFRLSEKEKEFFETVFESSTFRYRRELFLHLLKDTRVFNVDMTPINEVKVELSRIGNNVNQIARAINQGEQFNEFYYQNILETRKDLNELWHTLQSIQSKLP